MADISDTKKECLAFLHSSQKDFRTECCHSTKSKKPSKPFVMGKLLKFKEIYQLLDVAGLEIFCGAL